MDKLRTGVVPSCWQCQFLFQRIKWLTLKNVPKAETVFYNYMPMQVLLWLGFSVSSSRARPVLLKCAEHFQLYCIVCWPLKKIYHSEVDTGQITALYAPTHSMFADVIIIIDKTWEVFLNLRYTWLIGSSLKNWYKNIAVETSCNCMTSLNRLYNEGVTSAQSLTVTMLWCTGMTNCILTGMSQLRLQDIYDEIN